MWTALTYPTCRIEFLDETHRIDRDRTPVRRHKGNGMPASRPGKRTPPTRTLVSRNIVAGNGRTSMRLEPELWDALAEICGRQGLTIRQLVHEIEAIRGGTSGRTSAMRVYALTYFRAAATEPGHVAAGHGPLAGEPPG